MTQFTAKDIQELAESLAPHIKVEIQEAFEKERDNLAKKDNLLWVKVAGVAMIIQAFGSLLFKG